MTTVAPEPGDVIEDYEILEKIGGNMGLVFKARHRLLDKTVALKLLPADFIADPGRLARFQRELRVMGQLEHPHLVTAVDARVVAHWHLVAMELIEGMDLERLGEVHGALPIAPACEVARQAAMGLQHAHEHGLIHRDVKPSNLMLTHSGTVKVIDMGLALTRDDNTARLTQTGLVLGTMSYCAPEQFRDPSDVDIRADIYSLGCTLYHLITGKRPYSQRRTFAEVVNAHLHEPFPRLLDAQPDAPADLDPVIARMTAKDPAARFSTPSEVVTALEPFARGADLKQLLAARTPETSGRPTRKVASPEQVLATPAALATPRRGAVAPTARGAAGGEGHSARKTSWRRMVAAFMILLATVAAVFLTMNSLKRHSAVMRGSPVVFLMDTTAPNGVYDADNKTGGASNARELYKVLSQDGFMPPASLHPEPVFGDWVRENFVCSQRPDLVIIHRSSFFHSYNAEFKFGLAPEFARPADDPRWRFLYNFLGDERLKTLMGLIGNEVPQAKFLVYSRGTDTNWLSPNYRLEWVKSVEVRFPKLKDRIHTMVVPDGYSGTFRDPKTAAELRDYVKRILGLPEKPSRPNGI